MENSILNQGVSVTKYHKGYWDDDYFPQFMSIGVVVCLLTLPIKFFLPHETFFEWFKGWEKAESFWSLTKFWISFAFQFAFISLLIAALSTAFYEGFCSIFAPIRVVRTSSYKMTYYKNYFSFELVLYTENGIDSNVIEIPFDQIIKIRYNDESSTKRIKKIEIKIKEDFMLSSGLNSFFRSLDTSNLILSSNYRNEDVYKIVDALNDSVSIYKSLVESGQGALTNPVTDTARRPEGGI